MTLLAISARPYPAETAEEREARHLRIVRRSLMAGPCTLLGIPFADFRLHCQLFRPSKNGWELSRFIPQGCKP